LDVSPYVESEYTSLFRFDKFSNPKLKELRERYQLDAVVASGRDEFEQQVLLLDWVHHQFKKFGRPPIETTGALEILKAIVHPGSNRLELRGANQFGITGPVSTVEIEL